MCNCGNAAPSNHYGRLARVEYDDVHTFALTEISGYTWFGSKWRGTGDHDIYPDNWRWMDTLTQMDPTVPVVPSSPTNINMNTDTSRDCMAFQDTSGKIRNKDCTQGFPYFCEYVYGMCTFTLIIGHLILPTFLPYILGRVFRRFFFGPRTLGIIDFGISRPV